MEADVILKGATLELSGNVDVIADFRELEVTGGTSGYAFRDRSNLNNRFVLYAVDNIVRLYQDGIGDVLTISNGEIEMKKGFSSYAFNDRQNPNQRFILYANNNGIRFWKEGTGDVFTITDKTLQVENAKINTLNASKIILEYPLLMLDHIPSQTATQYGNIFTKQVYMKKEAGTDKVSRPIGNFITDRDFDLGKIIVDLLSRISQLEADVAGMKAFKG